MDFTQARNLSECLDKLITMPPPVRKLSLTIFHNTGGQLTHRILETAAPIFLMLWRLGLKEYRLSPFSYSGCFFKGYTFPSTSMVTSPSSTIINRSTFFRVSSRNFSSCAWSVINEGSIFFARGMVVKISRKF